MVLDSTTLKSRLKEITLIVSDVDGTLTNDRNEISEMTREYVAKLKDKNVIFTFATQKIHSSVINLAKQLDISVPFITANGRLVCDVNNKSILESYIKPKYIRKAIKLTKYYNVKIALCTNHEIIYTEDNSAITKLPHRIGTNFKLVDKYDDFEHSVVEIIIVGYDKRIIKHIHNKIRFPFGLFVKSNYFRLSSSSGMYNLDIRRSGIDKRTSLIALAKYLKVNKNQVAVIGDWYNDMDLFDFGGLNIALKNAVPRLRYLADYVIPKTNNEDGVGDFLKFLYEIKCNGS
ncbi:MAG TPA: Cof-type HAD-IIB family hydrolase [Ignavibacteria bacterium]